MGDQGFGSGTRIDAPVRRPNSRDSGEPSDDADAGADAADGSAPRVCLFIE